MDRMNEKTFYEALGAVPEVPGKVLEGVERRVRQSGVKRRTALAACLLLAFIIPALVLKQVNTSAVCAEEYEAMDELLYALDFLSGDLDIDYLLDVDINGSGNGSAAAEANSDGQVSLLSEKKIAKKLPAGAGKERSDEN